MVQSARLRRYSFHRYTIYMLPKPPAMCKPVQRVIFLNNLGEGTPGEELVQSRCHWLAGIEKRGGRQFMGILHSHSFARYCFQSRKSFDCLFVEEITYSPYTLLGQIVEVILIRPGQLAYNDPVQSIYDKDPVVGHKWDFAYLHLFFHNPARFLLGRGDAATRRWGDCLRVAVSPCLRVSFGDNGQPHPQCYRQRVCQREVQTFGGIPGWLATGISQALQNQSAVFHRERFSQYLLQSAAFSILRRNRLL